MEYYSVLTGDISGFTRLDDRQRQVLIRDTEKLFDELIIHPENARLFRGDSFQLIQEGVAGIVYHSLLIWCWFRSHSLPSAELGARMAIGVGKVAYRGQSVLDSDGEAFHLSGRSFDALERNQIMRIITNDDSLNGTFDTLLVYINRMIGEWTLPQVRLIYLVLRFPAHTQGQLAELLHISQPAVAKSLSQAHWRDVQRGLNFINERLQSHYAYN